MAAASAASELDVLGAWLAGRPSTRRVRSSGTSTPEGLAGLRFVLYGRMSTVEYQDEGSSRPWQYDSAPTWSLAAG